MCRPIYLRNFIIQYIIYIAYNLFMLYVSIYYIYILQGNENVSLILSLFKKENKTRY